MTRKLAGILRQKFNQHVTKFNQLDKHTKNRTKEDNSLSIQKFPVGRFSEQIMLLQHSSKNIKNDIK
jgi:hypothetical protein